jgi:hypothetical protein
MNCAKTVLLTSCRAYGHAAIHFRGLDTASPSSSGRAKEAPPGIRGGWRKGGRCGGCLGTAPRPAHLSFVFREGKRSSTGIWGGGLQELGRQRDGWWSTHGRPAAGGARSIRPAAGGARSIRPAAGGARKGGRRLEERRSISLSPSVIFGMPETHILQKTHFPDIVLRFRSKEIESFIPLGFIWLYIYCCAILMFGI